MIQYDFYDLFAASIQDGYIGGLIDMVKNIGGEEQMYRADADVLEKKGLSARMINHIINRRNDFDYDKVMSTIEKQNIVFIKYDSENFPQKLNNISSCPYGLFVKGDLPSEDISSVSIVGARNCSDYGRLMAEYFGDRLAKRGINIISGMAYGIDGISQMASIDAGGKSYAILGCGVDIIYPAGNRRLYERLVSGGGGVISEYIPGTPAISRNFPPRNRIISGLCDVLLVVEAREKSGTLITVDMAIDQGKDVCVVPGRITDPLSIGCLNLIHNGAYPVIKPDDVEELLLGVEKIDNKKINNNKINKKIKINKILNNKNIIKNENEVTEEESEKEIISEEAAATQKIKKECELTDSEKKIMDCLDYYPRSSEEIALRAGIDISKVMVQLTKLEIRGMIKCHSQGSFSKNVI